MTANLDEAQALGLLDGTLADIKRFLIELGASPSEIVEFGAILGHYNEAVFGIVKADLMEAFKL